MQQRGTTQLQAKDIKVKQVFSYFIWKIVKYKRIFIICILLEVISLVANVYLPVYMSNIFNLIGEVWAPTKELLWELYNILFIIGSLYIISTATSYFSDIILNHINSSGMKDITCECFEKLHQHSYRFFSDNLSWSLVRKWTKLASCFSRIVNISKGVILNIVITVPIMIYLIMKESILLGFLFLGFWIVFSLLNILVSKRNLKYERITNEWDSKMTWELSDTVINAFNIMTFASQKRETKSFSKTVETCRVLFRKKWNRFETAFLWISLVSLAFRISCLWICIWQWWLWNIAVWVIVLVRTYINKFTGLLWNVQSVFRSFNQTIWESTEMLAILNTPCEIQDKTNKKLKIKEWKIEFRDVKFWYVVDDAVMEQLNLTIKPWEKVAIVGESWSWKTTLVKLLFRFFDVWSWNILIDWQDISKVTQESLRSQISMVPQDALLFHRSLKENIWYANPKATEKDIINAAKMAKCHDFIMKLPDGYDSLVWERWIKLSWWERQRVAIARAILEKAKILVLDEATSSLDSESEFLIQSAMDEVMKWKTAIVIAHRLSTIMKMDRIIVMDEWVIVEEWTHEELIRKKWWVYHKLRSIQSWWFLTKDEWDKMNFNNEEKE